jgi:hypothetical protein
LKAFEQDPKNLEDLDLYSPKNQPFTTTSNGNRIMIFASNTQLQWLGKAPMMTAHSILVLSSSTNLNISPKVLVMAAIFTLNKQNLNGSKN